MHLAQAGETSGTAMNAEWFGPYVIEEAFEEAGTYILRELDGTQLAGQTAGKGLKLFRLREAASPETMAEGGGEPSCSGSEAGTSGARASGGVANVTDTPALDAEEVRQTSRMRMAPAGKCRQAMANGTVEARSA
ncbi:MAG: hypothetical protein BJ554DRAFT_2269 [Olpidium bornovanus]|uniref:Uncharacterized protein n=1 Tax=Olpidium bornovanus TaxID=278681 RepID=A0A8H8DGF7_9FUNG|nr:MAG: hypothetical protein BJ554DRAFT_2269 [Olpidium bornovanus]